MPTAVLKAKTCFPSANSGLLTAAAIISGYIGLHLVVVFLLFLAVQMRELPGRISQRVPDAWKEVHPMIRSIYEALHGVDGRQRRRAACLQTDESSLMQAAYA